MEIPRFAKHLAEVKKGKTAKEPPAPSAEVEELPLAEKKQRAEDVLFGRLDKMSALAKKLLDEDVDKANELLGEMKKMLAQIEEIRAGKMGIDDIEAILRQAQDDKGGKGTESEAAGERTVEEVVARTPEGKEVRVNLAEQAKHWNAFYVEHKIDWVEPIPEDIKLTEEQAEEMKRQIEELGHDWPVIIPKGLTGQPEFEEYEAEEEDPKTKKKKKVKKIRLKKPSEHYRELHELMSEGYKGKTFYGDNYKEDGKPVSANGIGASEDKRTGLRIVMAKKVKEIADDEKLKETLNKSVDDLSAVGGLFEKWGVEGMTEAEYLIFQRAYYEETEEHMDANYYIWLAGSKRLSSGRVPRAHWRSAGGRLGFRSGGSGARGDGRGCRPVGSFEL